MEQVKDKAGESSTVAKILEMKIGRKENFYFSLISLFIKKMTPHFATMALSRLSADVTHSWTVMVGLVYLLRTLLANRQFYGNICSNFPCSFF